MSQTIDPRSPAALRQKLAQRKTEPKPTPVVATTTKPEPPAAKKEPPASEREKVPQPPVDMSPEAVEVRKQKKAAKAAKKLAARQAKRLAVERLPHNSRFDIAPFDAENAQWTGSLTIPCIHCENGHMPSDGRECEECSGTGAKQTFSTTASAIFKLLMRLDGMYRAWLAEQTPKPEESPAQ